MATFLSEVHSLGQPIRQVNFEWKRVLPGSDASLIVNSDYLLYVYDLFGITVIKLRLGHTRYVQKAPFLTDKLYL